MCEQTAFCKKNKIAIGRRVAHVSFCYPPNNAKQQEKKCHLAWSVENIEKTEKTPKQ